MTLTQAPSTHGPAAAPPRPTSTGRAPDQLHATVTLSESGFGSLSMSGKITPIRGTDLNDARQRIRDMLTARADDAQQPVSMTCTDPAGTFTVLVHPDGTITSTPEAQNTQPADTEPTATDTPPPATPASTLASPHHIAPPPASPDHAAPTAPTPLPTIDAPPAPAAPPQPSPPPSTPSPTRAAAPAPAATQPDPLPAESEPIHPTTRAELRAQALQESLLDTITTNAPAQAGLRGALNSMGLRLAPSKAERGSREDIAAVAQHWPRPRTIAVVNGKGGAGKTPTTILLAATFARYGGAGVVAWDNNPTRGTLGWRTLQGPHQATIEDLLPNAASLMEPDALAASMARYTHHQRTDRYDVLRSRPEALRTFQPTDAASVAAVHRVLTKYYRLILIDSGNDESSSQWEEMISRSDAIVVPTITRPEHAESARLLLAELAGAGEHCAHLARNAMVIVSQASRAEPAPRQLVDAFHPMARTVVGIPYDPAMSGRPLLLDQLAPTTRRAWLTAAAQLTGALATS